MYYVLALRNLTRRKVRTVLSSLGIMIGVAMIISLVSVSDGLKKTTDDFTRTVGTSLFVVAEGTFGPPMASNLDMKVVDEIQKIPGVQLASPIVMVGVSLKSSEGGALAGGSFGMGQEMIGLIGVDPSKESQTSSEYTKVTAGRMIRAGEKDSAILGVTLARKINKRAGDSVQISYKGTDYTFDIVGIYETDGTSDNGLVTDIASAQKVGSLPSYRINAVRVLPDNPDRNEELARKIKLLVNGVDPSYATSMTKTLSSFTSTLQTVTWVIAGIAALIGGIGIANTMVMSVMEQTKEIGILKAVGWKNKDVVGMVLMESLAISVIGAGVGILVGGAVTLFALPLAFKGTFTPVLTVATASEAFLFALALGLLGGLLPARRAAGLDPLEAFKYAE